jgi:hypothetical protein
MADVVRYSLFEDYGTPEEERRKQRVEDALSHNSELRRRLITARPLDDSALIPDLMSQLDITKEEALDLLIWVRLQVVDIERIITGQEPRWPDERKEMRDVYHKLHATKSFKTTNVWEHIDADD